MMQVASSGGGRSRLHDAPTCKIGGTSTAGIVRCTGSRPFRSGHCEMHVRQTQHRRRQGRTSHQDRFGYYGSERRSGHAGVSRCAVSGPGDAELASHARTCAWAAEAPVCMRSVQCFRGIRTIAAGQYSAHVPFGSEAALRLERACRATGVGRENKETPCRRLWDPNTTRASGWGHGEHGMSKGITACSRAHREFSREVYMTAPGEPGGGRPLRSAWSGLRRSGHGPGLGVGAPRRIRDLVRWQVRPRGCAPAASGAEPYLQCLLALEHFCALACHFIRCICDAVRLRRTACSPMRGRENVGSQRPPVRARARPPARRLAAAGGVPFRPPRCAPLPPPARAEGGDARAHRFWQQHMGPLAGQMAGFQLRGRSRALSFGTR